MKIGNFLPQSFNDYPGFISSVIFTKGCNLRCPFCHNSHLIGDAHSDILDEDLVLRNIFERKLFIDAVVISGGEPLLQDDLIPFVEKIKSKTKLKIKIDTNGSFPNQLHEIIDSGLVDFIAMDIKAPFDKYPELCGTKINAKDIERSIEIICESNIEHQFRTTFVPTLLTNSDLATIKSYINADQNNYVVQKFNQKTAWNLLC